jgi:hypothetical protein
MSNDVAEIQSTFCSIGVQAAQEQIQNKLNLLARFKVTGAEAKRNIIRSLSRASGVNQNSAFKESASLIQISEIKEDGKWIVLK